ncbi:MAG: hypothetical protein ABJF04_05915 [Reichenbachiella sp.]|uniref:hypothetical protein n=1 Tax=Reichenbachiella sp. TaxID=2184521 RepID=UPI003263B396
MKKIHLALAITMLIGNLKAQVHETNDEVGIGISNPASKLHVEGEGSYKSNAWFGKSFVSNPVYHFDRARVGISGTSDNGQFGAGIHFQVRNNSNTNYLHAIVGQNRDGRMIFETGGAGINAPTEKVTILTDGSVGIGTSSPTMKTHIKTAVNEIDGLRLTVDGTNDDGGVGLFLWNASGGTGGIIALDEKDHNGLAPNALNMYSNWSPLTFSTSPNSSENYERMRILTNGNVGIGTTDPQSKLAVEGQIRATEVRVLADISVPDYVFEEDYRLRTLQETKAFISANKHLPEIPSAAEISENGIDLGDMNMRLLKKIEELTLHQIELLERIEKLENSKN